VAPEGGVVAHQGRVAAGVMPAIRPSARHRRVAVAAVSCAALLAGLGAAAPAAGSTSRENRAVTTASCGGWTSVPPPNPGSANVLNAVDVLSSSNVWAAGSYDPLGGDPTKALVEH
jgi:hypothetical protein